MGLTALDIVVLVGVAAAALLGLMRGFVSEVLSLFAWVAAVMVLKLFHAPATKALVGIVGTLPGSAVLAFVLLAGVTWFLGRLVANAIGRRTRTSVLGPVDRALGLGFGAVKGLLLASLAFMAVAFVVDFAHGGAARRPPWMVQSRTYALLNTTSAAIADILDRRRRGEPIFRNGPPPAARR